MSKFKVGDVVIGNKRANENNITNEGWVGIVTEINCDGREDLIKLREAVSISSDYVYGTNRYFTVRACGFDSCSDKVLAKTISVRQSKEDLLAKLSSQGDCYYSLAQVVDMIKSIEDPKPVLYSKVQVTAEGYDSFLDCVRDRFEANFAGHGGTNRFIDLDTADFSLNGNRVELDSVDLNADEVVDTAVECLENVLIQYVEVLEKSDLLEA